jgi:hypothetical protein
MFDMGDYAAMIRFGRLRPQMGFAVGTLFDVVDNDGGPLIYGVSSEQQQRSFDSTCREFHRFLDRPPR